MRISKPATPTARSQPAIAIVVEIVKQVACISVKDLRAHRHAHNQIIAFATRAIRAFAVRTALGGVQRVIAQVQQRVQRPISYENDVAAATTIAARWTTARHKLLAPESRNTVTSVTPLYVNLGAINKHPKLKTTPKRALLLPGVANFFRNFSKQQFAPLDKR